MKKVMFVAAIMAMSSGASACGWHFGGKLCQQELVYVPAVISAPKS